MSSVQDEVFAFLEHSDAWPGRPAHVDVIGTHGAKVFLAGDDVIKIKRAVRLPYLDFSTLAARKHYCEREIALNAAGAPGIYRGAVAITRQDDGTLAIAGRGEPVEWAVHMHRFPQDDLLINVVQRGAFTLAMADTLADRIFRYHSAAPVAPASSDGFSAVCKNVLDALALHLANTPEACASLKAMMEEASRPALRSRRAARGHIRRCHGDLHLGNIVLWKGDPVPFDALEFDETLATTDTLYDLAFLLMDLDRNGARDMANAVLNRYLWRSRDLIDVEGLALLPGFLGLRAAIRAMVTFDRIATDPDGGAALRPEAMTLVDAALSYLSAATPKSSDAPRLVAVGGLSGTGKTTLARALAPLLGPAPGALHVRSDMERKAVAGLEPTERLPPSAYTKESGAAIYARMSERAHAGLTAGHCVVLDAVFAHENERAQAQGLAALAGVPFTGIWLEGPQETLAARVAARTGDASDATAEVVARQFTYDTGPIRWHRIEAGGDAQATRAAAIALLHQP
jgi:aminoglycoside phosphotransferase family enzyme/predicted kinase